MKNKIGAIEMTAGKIITIVLIISVLILCIYLFKNIFSPVEYGVTYNMCYNKTITPLYKFDLYVSEGCPHCANQKEILGSYLDEVGGVIDCASDGARCIEDNITAVPTWKIHNGNEQYTGVHTISQLAEILEEVDYEWVCEDFDTDMIFKEENRDVNISITNALEIEKETNRSFKDECEGYGGDFIEGNFSYIWTCRLVQVVPIINKTDITGKWLEKNCGMISFTKENIAFKCYDKFTVRKK
jgi:hypothetical protein